jgi:hypothetical protein
MQRRHRIGLITGLALVLAVGYFATRGPAPPTPTSPGSFAFGVLGDQPYTPFEEVQFRLVLDDLDAHDLAFVLHVGDIFGHPCTDRLYLRRRAALDRLRHPLIYTPGDNEWTDCWAVGSGRFEPRERLERLRQLFFDRPTQSLGGRPLPLVSQGSGGGPYAEYVENARWSEQGIVFATLHLPGSRNALEPFPDRTEADDQESLHRTQAAVAWLHQAFDVARDRDAAAVVLGFHANLSLGEPLTNPYRQAYELVILALEEEAARFSRPILLAQGDEHEYVVDHPLLDRSTGQPFPHVTRLQVPGSPLVGWVRVEVTPGAPDPFAFEERLVPRWKYW